MGRLDDEGEALALQAQELARQLADNQALSGDEREQLAARLRQLQARLGAARGAGGAVGAGGVGRKGSGDLRAGRGGS